MANTSRFHRTVRVLCPVALLAVPVAWACSPATGTPAEGGGFGGANGHNPLPTAGNSSRAGSSSSVPGTGGDPGIINIEAGGSNGTDGGCFATGSKAEHSTKIVEVPVTKEITTLKPFDMFIMYDQSGSMNQDTPVGSKWSAIQAALTAFVQDPLNTDVGVGIQYFPTAPPPCSVAGPDCVCIPFVNICAPTGGGSCNAADYAKPDVPINVLSAAANQVIASLTAHKPGGGTPTAPALDGALQYAKAWAAAHPDRNTIVVLATDGDPSGCTANTVQDVANIAASGLAATPPVKTFVVGVGSSLTSLNSIAAAGGSTEALIVDAANGDPTKQFLDAMNKIREKVTTTETHTETHTETQTRPIACEWSIPPSPDGKKFDKAKVNVDYSADANATPQRIGAVSSEADCASTGTGWHYDDPDNPTKVLVCPDTCKMIQGSPDAFIQVIFGCKTEVAR